MGKKWLSQQMLNIIKIQSNQADDKLRNIKDTHRGHKRNPLLNIKKQNRKISDAFPIPVYIEFDDFFIIL